MKDLRKDSVLICPKNDEESLMILKVAEKFGLKTVVSDQPHGAKLAREKDLVARVQETNSNADTLVIIELPGPEKEQELRDLGYEVVIIDHHTYDDLDRMKDRSSLEQFLEIYDIDDTLLKAFGFDPKMVEAVAAIDRGFLWELDRLDWSEADKARARKFYRSLTMELGPERRAKEEEAARGAWENREQKDGYLVIRAEQEDVSIRDALSFIVAEKIGEPTPTIIKQGTRRIYVQETDRVEKLKEAFGGFTFGQNRCWGLLREDGSLPSVEDVLDVLRS